MGTQRRCGRTSTTVYRRFVFEDEVEVVVRLHGPGGVMGEDVPWNERPCVGLCYLRKLHNLPPMKDPSVGRKRCIGMCYRSRLRGREDQWRKKEENVQAKALASQVNGKPCIGLCYTEKLKAEKARRMAEESESNVGTIN